MPPMSVTWLKDRAKSRFHRNSVSSMPIPAIAQDPTEHSSLGVFALAKSITEASFAGAFGICRDSLDLCRDKARAALSSVHAHARLGIESASDFKSAWRLAFSGSRERKVLAPAQQPWNKVPGRTEIEKAFNLCKASLVVIFGISFFVNLLALTVPLYLLQVYDHVLSSRSLDTLVMLTVIVVMALAVHSTLEALRRAMLSRIGGWLDDRLSAPVLVAAVQAALRNDGAAAAQAWRDIGSFRSFF